MHLKHYCRGVDKKGGLSHGYSQPAILHAPHFWRVLNPHNVYERDSNDLLSSSISHIAFPLRSTSVNHVLGGVNRSPVGGDVHLDQAWH